MKRALGKVAVVTGATSGIGLGIAKKFLEEGAMVVAIGRNVQKLQTLQQEFPKELLAVQGDISKKEDLENLYRTTKTHFGLIDTLIVNAGIGRQIPLKEVTEKDFDSMMMVNYRGAFFSVRYALDYLKECSSVLFIASIAAYGTVKGHSVYSSNKAAVLKLTKNFSFDLAERKIRVNSISPGYIKTPIFDERIAKEPDYVESRTKYIPLGKMGTPEDIANAALFLSSDEASFISGADLVIDGGYLASYPLPD